MIDTMRSPTFTKLIFNNLSFYKAANLWVFAAVTIAAMAITGALFIGDSVRFTLKNRAAERLGWVGSAMYAADRWFTTELGLRLRTNLNSSLPNAQVKTTYAIKLDGSVAKPDETGRANRVNIYGVTHDFWNEKGREKFDTLPPKNALINQPLAEHLNVKPGDEVIIRIKKPVALSFELPISLQENAYVGMRVRIHAIISGKEMGNFSMTANQLPPFNLFMRYDEIAKAVDKTGMANLLLCNLDSWAISGGRTTNLLTESLTPDDCGIEFRLVRDNLAELRSQRVFIEKAVCDKAVALANSEKWREVFDTNAIFILTYLANLFSRDGKQTPYSIITAANEPIVPGNLKDDEILIIRWLADDLDAKPGDAIHVQYYLPDAGGKLVEATNTFRVAAIVPHELPWFDKTLLPEIPGLAKAESTQDWNLGFPLIHKFRKKDDDYWRDYRGTPKAFIPISTGKKLWSNRFGELTAVRFRIKNNQTNDVTLRQFATDLVKNCGAGSFGYSFEPIRANSLIAAENSQDFGGLFLGFSFFLVVSALLLVALLFSLNIERRFREFGIYMAVGFSHKDVAKLVFYEVFAIITTGAVVGGIFGMLYSKLMLQFLSTVWREVSGGMDWEFYGSTASFCIGVCSAILCSFIAVFSTIRRLKNKSIKNIFQQGIAAPSVTADTRKSNPFRNILRTGIPILLIVLGILNAVKLIVTRQFSGAEGFFISGVLLLSGTLMILPTILRASSTASLGYTGMTSLAIRSAARNIKRTVLTAGMFACGFFILVSVSVFRLDVGKDVKKPSSGTGGFDLIAECSIPVIKDLNTEDGLNNYGLDKSSVGNAFFVPFRVKEGDEASCFNLNRAVRPRLLGGDWRLLTNRFTFSMYEKKINVNSPWELLNQVSTNYENGLEIPVVPAIGDADSIQWSLGKKISDTIDFNDEFGHPFKIKIVGGVANSVLQGNLIINEEIFRRLFPGESGYKFFLIECRHSESAEVAKTLSRAFSDYGMEIVTTVRRLAQFNAVQNTYVGAFQILGGIGFLLGSVGIAIILFRNVLERRNELAVMVAVGFTEKSVRRLVITEHAIVIIAGIVIGIIPAIISLLPSITSESQKFSLRFVVVLIMASVVLSYIWTAVASRMALKTRLTDALRIE
jgi:ABC-type antimicrobial peptide transport system permease subunit